MGIIIGTFDKSEWIDDVNKNEKNLYLWKMTSIINNFDRKKIGSYFSIEKPFIILEIGSGFLIRNSLSYCMAFSQSKFLYPFKKFDIVPNDIWETPYIEKFWIVWNVRPNVAKYSDNLPHCDTSNEKEYVGTFSVSYWDGTLTYNWTNYNSSYNQNNNLNLKLTQEKPGVYVVIQFDEDINNYQNKNFG